MFVTLATDNTIIEIDGGNEWTNEKSLPHTGED